MKRHRPFKQIVLLLGVILASGACTDGFEEMNSNPNSPEVVTPAVLLPNAIESSVDRYWGQSTRFERLNIDGGMLWMQYLTRNIYSNEGDNYSVGPEFHANNWKGFYNDAAVNFQRVINLSGPEGDRPNTNYEGIGLVMRSWVFSLLTDLYGAIPYSEALKGTAAEPVYTPEYDAQEAVYAGLLNDLKLANEKLVVGGPQISGDIMFGGDIMRWKKFANSLRLKLANRQAAKKPGESRAVMAEILGDPATYPVFSSNEDYAALRHSAVLPSNNEWHQVMIQSSRTDWNVSQTLVDKLKELDDDRLTVFAEPNPDGEYLGHPNGLPDGIATTYLGKSSVLGSRFLAANAPSVLMSYSELLFVLAEAAFDGDISGDAQDYYEKAIAASFDQYGLSMPESYLEGAGAATKENIMTQKWIAMFGQGVEAWTEYRRTGLPKLPPADPRSVFLNDGVLPTRLQYPGTEYSLNAEKLEKGISLNGGPDNMKTTLWWVE